MPHTYTEDQLVEQPAIGLFAELGWTTVSALEEVFGCAEPSPQASPSGRGSTAQSLGRETKGEVVLVSRLRAAQSALPNPQPGLSATLLPVGEGTGDERAQLALPPEAITAAVDELTRDRSAMSLFSGQATHPHPASPEGERCMKTN